MKSFRLNVLLASVLACMTVNNVTASSLNVSADAKESGLKSLQVHVIPYGFYNKNTGAAVAAVVVADGLFQSQATGLINAFVGTNSTTNIFAYLSDYQLPMDERLFMDVQLMSADWGETESFQSGNTQFLGERAGTNDSDQDNFIEAEGTDKHVRLKFKMILPIGDGDENPIHTYKIRSGLLEPESASGGGEWNPLGSGRTSFVVEPFYRDQDFEGIDTQAKYQSKTSGVKFNLEYDNTDWYKNPTKGSRQSFSVTRDWGALDESPTWTALQFEWSKYISLPLTENTRQRVLAYNFWTSDVPTWDSSNTADDGSEVFHRAPVFEGSTLGGLDRQRGFASNRFSDRSAINYAVEYRHSPANNPFTDVPIINKLHIPWWEWVAFAEVGRVADRWSVGELHKDMKVSVGAGVRASVYGLIIRVDGAVSEDGGAVQMFFDHTF